MSDENVVKLKIDGQTYEVDMSDLEIGEIGAIEDLTGKSVQDIDWDSARGMQGLVWIAMHRKNPSFRIEDAGRIKFSALEDAEEQAEKPRRPTKAAA